MKKTMCIVIAAVIFTSLPLYAAKIPLGFSISGGIGKGYYAMTALNAHISAFRADYPGSIDDLSSGINLTAQGRVWFYNVIAVTGGYAYLYGETSDETGTVIYETPANVYTLGLVGTLYKIPDVVDLDIGVDYLWCSSVFGTNLFSGNRLTEFKGEDNGYQIYGEAITNFIRPVEIGFQFGYRMLKVENLIDRRGNPPETYIDWGVSKMTLDYSGLYFYLTVGIDVRL
jgi:hypothetical protein